MLRPVAGNRRPVACASTGALKRPRKRKRRAVLSEEGARSREVVRFAIQAIPSLWIISPTGKIVARDVQIGGVQMILEKELAGK